jgi:hypothetical protein
MINVSDCLTLEPGRRLALNARKEMPIPHKLQKMNSFVKCANGASTIILYQHSDCRDLCCWAQARSRIFENLFESLEWRKPPKDYVK